MNKTRKIASGNTYKKAMQKKLKKDCERFSKELFAEDQLIGVNRNPMKVRGL